MSSPMFLFCVALVVIVNGGYALYYLGNEKKVLRYDVTEEEDADFVHLNDTLADLGSHFRGGKVVNDPRSLEEFLVDAGVSERMMDMANAGKCHAGGMGCDFRTDLADAHNLLCGNTQA